MTREENKTLVRQADVLHSAETAAGEDFAPIAESLVNEAVLFAHVN